MQIKISNGRYAVVATNKEGQDSVTATFKSKAEADAYVKAQGIHIEEPVVHSEEVQEVDLDSSEEEIEI